MPKRRLDFSGEVKSVVERLFEAIGKSFLNLGSKDVPI